MDQSSSPFQTSGLSNKIFSSFVLLIGFTLFSSAQDCVIQEFSNNFETAFGDVENIEVADDITVEANQNFILEKFTFNLWLEDTVTVDLDMVNLRFYENGGELPGARFAEIFLKPTKDSIVGIGDGGFTVHRITVELDTLVKFVGQANEKTTYWIGVLTPNAPSSAYYESSNASSSEILSCFFLSGTWRNSYLNGTELLGKACVFKAEGICEELSTATKNIELDSRISVFPNPTFGILNIDIPSDLTVKEVSLFDNLGKETRVTFINKQFDISGLPNGVYLAQIATDEGTIIKRFLKL